MLFKLPHYILASTELANLFSLRNIIEISKQSRKSKPQFLQELNKLLNSQLNVMLTTRPRTQRKPPISHRSALKHTNRAS